MTTLIDESDTELLNSLFKHDSFENKYHGLSESDRQEMADIVINNMTFASNDEQEFVRESMAVYFGKLPVGQAAWFADLVQYVRKVTIENGYLRGLVQELSEPG